MTPIDSEADVLRRYLLDGLDRESREDVERRLFSDDRLFWERFCLIEDELIDDYVRGDLTGDDRDRAERHFLCTAERQGKVAFARALQEYVAATRVEQEPVQVPLWRRLRMPVAVPSWAAAAAVALLFVLPAVTWQFSDGRNQTEVNAWLSPDFASRAEGRQVERVTIPGGASLVRFRLEVGADEYASYRAALSDVNGTEIWSQGGLETAAIEGKVGVTLTLPAEILPEGDYVIRLSGLVPAGDTALPDRYEVRVLRE